MCVKCKQICINQSRLLLSALVKLRKKILSEIVGVLLPLPFNDVFDYKVKSDNVALGSIVRVPWGREQQVGVVWKLGKSADIPESKIKLL